MPTNDETPDQRHDGPDGTMIDQDARRLAVRAAQVADAEHATDVLVLHVGDVLGVTEYFVIGSASNRRLVSSIVDDVEEQLKDDPGRAPVRVEGFREQQWVLLDYGDVVVHIFLAEIRDFYEIERLYTDVPKVDWSAA